MLRFITSLAFCVLSLAPFFGQTLEEKYNNYKVRFYGDQTAQHPGFIRVGEGRGMSTPMSHHNRDEDCENSYHYLKNCQPLPNNHYRGKLKWGDGTVWLSEYYFFLASEFYLKNFYQEDLTDVINEIGLSLKAYERLDLNAEDPYGVTPEVDGFFLRSDPEEDYLLNADSSYAFLLENPFDSTLNGFQCIEAGYCGGYDINNGNFVSQDQIVALVSGLYAYIKLIPQEIEYQGVSIVDWSKSLMHTMINHARENNWNIKDPQGNSPPEQWGGSVTGLSYILAETANKVIGNQYINGYQNFKSTTQGYAMWQGLLTSFQFQQFFNKNMALKMLITSEKKTTSEISLMAYNADKHLYALMAAVLNGGSMHSAVSQAEIDSILHEAPFDGPCMGVSNCIETPGWMAYHRFNESHDKTDGNPYELYGHWNGLDFLCFYNYNKIYNLPDHPLSNLFNQNTEAFINFLSVERILEINQPTNSISKQINIDLYDMSGRLIDTKIIEGKTKSLKYNYLQPGAYIFKCKFGESSVVSKKVVIL